MGVVAALILEEVGLNVLEDGEENAARLIGCNTAARAGYALRDGSWKTRCQWMHSLS